MQPAHFGFRLAEVPARTRYFRDASSISFGLGAIYGARTLLTAAKLIAHRRGILRSRKFSD
jgi:hypothetical protein